MAVVIDEMVANVEAAPQHDGAGEGEPRPTEDQEKQAMINLLELLQERRARLAID